MGNMSTGMTACGGGGALLGGRGGPKWDAFEGRQPPLCLSPRVHMMQKPAPPPPRAPHMHQLTNDKWLLLRPSVAFTRYIAMS